MPPNTTLREFIHALATGDTNVTCVLERLANNAEQRAAHTEDIGRPGAFNGRLPEWLRIACIQNGMTSAELDHIERWPDAQKEIVRSQIDQASAHGRPIHFSWELHAGDDPLSEVRRDQDQDVRIVFLSPRKGVKLSSKINLGDITVDD